MECHTGCPQSLHSTCKGVAKDACAVALGASLRETQDIRPSSAAGCSARGGNENGLENENSVNVHEPVRPAGGGQSQVREN